MDVGKKYIVKSRRGNDKGYATAGHPPYPGFREGRKVEVLAEYPNFFVVMVLPRESALGVTEPYRVTIDKWEIGRMWDIKEAS